MSDANGSFSKKCATERAWTSTEDQVARPSTQATLRLDQILVTCPSCKTTLSVSRVYIGKSVRCRRCNQNCLVPASADTEPSPPYGATLGVPQNGSQQGDANPQSRRTGTANGPMLDQLAQFIASYDELRTARDQLQAEHYGVQVARDEVRAQLKCATNELNAIRAELGSIAPADVQSLASEREAFSAEVSRLRAEKQAFLTDQSNREGLIARLEERVVELVAIQQERDDLLKSSRDECEQVRHHLDLCMNDLRSIQTDLGRVNGEYENALATIERLNKAIAERDHEIAVQCDQFSAELETRREALRCGDRSHSEERVVLETELASVGARYDRLSEEHRAAESSCAELQARNRALSAAQEQLEAQYRTRLESEQFERQKLAEELLELRANSEETTRVAEELLSAALNLPSAPIASAEELEAARVQMEQLRDGIAESEYLNRVMAETLESVGIQVSFPSRPRDNVLPAS